METTIFRGELLVFGGVPEICQELNLKKTGSTQVALLQLLDATHFARGQVRLRANGIRLKMDLFLFGIKWWKS